MNKNNKNIIDPGSSDVADLPQKLDMYLDYIKKVHSQC